MVGSILQVDVGRHSEAKVDVSSSFVISTLSSATLSEGVEMGGGPT